MTFIDTQNLFRRLGRFIQRVAVPTPIYDNKKKGETETATEEFDETKTAETEE